MIVAYKNGNPVRLEELGKVLDGVENDKVSAWLNDTRTIILAIHRQPGTNTVEVVDNVKTLLPAFRAEIPAVNPLGIIFDRSTDIRDSIDDVKFTLMLTVCLVVMVIFLFLRNLSATLIPGVAVPLSIVGTFAVMYLLGYSLNNLSLMALTLSVGFVVDDAIVMLENIVRHMEMGESRMEAARRRLARDRLHHRLDDHLAGQRFHSRAVHGRNRRTPAARIFRHHRGRDSGLRIRLADPDAHAGQPLPAPPATAKSTGFSTTRSSAVFRP